MALILNIDTATEAGSVCLSREGEELAFAQSGEQKDHASWLHPAIEKLVRDAGHRMQDLEAVAVTAGPGSYTGLRVSMAAAKGLCYALNIPLITENTLKVMALAGRPEQKALSASLICPMIDARRLEVFAALYGNELQEIWPPAAMILDEHAFEDQLLNQTILFIGSGSKKWKSITRSANALFGETVIFLSSHLARLSYHKFIQKQFTDIIYSEPVYLKEFHSHTKK